MRRSVLAAVSVLSLLVAGCAGDADDAGGADDATSTTATIDDTGSTAPGDAPEPSPAPEPPPEPGALQPVVGGLEVPWEIAFVDGDTLLVTERPGRVRVVDGGVLRDEPVLTVRVDDEGEGGLLGIALHPDFPSERSAYLYETKVGANRVVRYHVGDDLTLSNPEALLDGMPASVFHDGGRIAFGPDGMLYVTTGDAQQPELAADLGSLAGKILRIAPDGAIPDDNPFPGSAVWSYGHRNAQGLAWDAGGRLYASEHGPTGEFELCCLDEINLVRPGGFYGWPYLAANTRTGAGEPPEESIAPLASSGPDDPWAPAGVTFLGTGDDASLLVTTLRAEVLLRFPVGSDGAVGDGSVALEGLGRTRLAAVGPDGCLWVGTSNRDGRGDPRPGDDHLLRAC